MRKVGQLRKYMVIQDKYVVLVMLWYSRWAGGGKPHHL